MAASGDGTMSINFIPKPETLVYAVCRRLRIVAAGGDGTMSWLLSTIRSLELVPIPPVAIIPLGTCNGISVNLGWGRTGPSESVWFLW